MRLHAFLKDNTVVEIRSISEQQYFEEIRNYELILDIEDQILKPQIGWILKGNKLTPPPSAPINLSDYVNAKIEYYQTEAPKLLREFYTENTLLGITVQQSDEMFDAYQDVLMRLREGAWTTALYRLSQKQPSGFVTQALLNKWVGIIQARMQQ
jgi:hypothetical protein